MKETIIKMIELAAQSKNYDMLDQIKELILEFALTYNCPSDWRSIGSELAKMYQDNQWVYDNLELWNHE